LVWAALGALGAVMLAPAVQAAPATWSPQAPRYGEGSQLNVGVTMADGTVLRADVFYPTVAGTTTAAGGSFPVLLQQTPYGKEAFSAGSSLTATDVPYFVDRGYVVVISDVRGTGDSGGTFGLFDPVQQSDGATMARWAARLPHSDGKVGLFGESYMGINQFLTVAGLGSGSGASSPVRAMFPIIAGHDIFSDSVVQGGIPDLEFSAAYLALVTGLNAASPLLEPLAELGSTNPAAALSGLGSLLQTELTHNEDLSTYDLALLEGIELGQANAFDGPYWAARSPATYLKDVVTDHIPAFLVGGWNDLFQEGEPLNYVGLQNLYAGRPETAPMSPSQAVTPRYQLMMGPWQHVTTGAGVDLSAIMLEWFDTWLLGQNTPLAHTTTPVHLEDLHSGSWVDTADWPVAPAGATPFYFGPGGSLTATPPSARNGSDPMIWDGLSSPCSIQTDQWAAGALALAASSLGTKFPCDTNDATLGLGPAALTYTSAPFPHPEELAGPIDATVEATATTTDAELVATVEEVSPTGQSVPLTSGALLGSLRALSASQTWMGRDGLPLLPAHPYTAASSQPVRPGQVTRYDISVFPTFAQIPAGWRLRVTLTSADTPHLMPTLTQGAHLVGGVYQVQRTAPAPSVLNVPLAPVSSLSTPCGALCSPGGP
jgi:hypothetical protein